MSDRPYLFLDVDGVLNATSAPLVGDWNDFKSHKIKIDLGSGLRQTFTLHLSREMCAALVGLDVDIRWVTTWENQANTLLRKHTGLPWLPVAASASDAGGWASGERQNWKWQGVQRILEIAPRPTIWIDDEAIPSEASDWLTQRSIPHLFVVPDPTVGITQQDIGDLTQFLAALP